MDQPSDQIRALIELHRGLERQGPGDAVFSKHILSMIPGLPRSPRIADLGSGAGAGALVLAEWFNAPVTAVDFSRTFLGELVRRAKARGLGHLVRTVEADFGALDWPARSLDLLWSEGAAYTLTFAGALTAWRPLLAPGGVAAISELSWFMDDPPEPVREYWQNAYPAIGSESENAARGRAAGFEVLGVHRLPEQAWWANYYDPLMARMDVLRPHADSAMQAAIRETEAEMELFRAFGDAYGYAFYVLLAA